MPARKERIYIYGKDENFEFEFPVWWDRTKFFLKFGDREIDTNHPLYVNYAFLLMTGEAMAFNKECRTAFYNQQSNRPDQVKLDMEGVESILKKAKWVIVESYEWD